MIAQPTVRQSPVEPTGVRHRKAAGAAGGVLAVLMTFAVAEFLAAVGAWIGALSTSASPVRSLGAGFIAVSPGPLVEWAKKTLGAPGDKIALGIGIGVTVILAGAVVGLLLRRRPASAIGAAVLLAAVAATAIWSQADAGIADVLPLAVGTACGIAVLVAVRRRLSAEPGPGGAAGNRREFLRLLGWGAAGTVAAGTATAFIPSTAASDASRAQVKLGAAEPAPGVIADGKNLDAVTGISPYVTDNAAFYRIDTAFSIPRLTTADWGLRIHGLVDRPMRLTFAQLQARPMISRMVTLTCVSNPVGGELIGNALWQGIRIDDLLAEVGVQEGADCLLSTDVKGFTCTTPISALTDGRDAMLAIGMNGEPLPPAHGFPVRQVVPGLYGYVSATKWVVDWKISRFADETAYWTALGWSAQAPIKTSARIDVPGDTAAAGEVPIAGVAWAQHTGISAVAVQIDGGSGWGPWLPAEISRPVSADTWVQWVYRWQATPGSYKIRCRATDSAGAVQIGADADVMPDGATGYHTRSVTVSA